MRRIGQISDESSARRFSDYLYVKGIENRIETSDGEMWNVWVHDEHQLIQAKRLLAEFQNNPDDAKYRNARETAHQQRKQEKEEFKAYQKRFLNADKIFPGGISRIGRLTVILIAISVIVAVISVLGKNMAVVRYLLISEYRVINPSVPWYMGLVEISKGQIWRIFTPIFLHFGFLHILFNMLWLRDLGTMIEKQQNTWILGLLVIVIAPISNLAQYAVSGPMFGGMSGVVYGLLGYIWIRGKYDPFSGLYLHRQTVTMMIIWFFLCLTGLMGNIANMAHGAGLAIGMVWGFISAHLSKRTYIR
jgi:GlpG protein